MLPRPRLLIADDHLSYAESIGRWFALRFDVRTPVTDLDNVEQVIRVDQPAITLLDIQFDRRSALDILPAIIRHSRTRILMVTARDDLASVVRAFEGGAIGYFLKVDGLQELDRAVAQVLAGVRYVAPELRLPFEALQRGSTILLTPRQLEVIEAIRATKTQAEAAARLGIASSTLEKHVRGIKKRRGITDTRKWLEAGFGQSEINRD